MRWNYDDSTRDLFSQGPHRDILIVPHATYVTPVTGGPPIITSKVPQFQWIPVPVYDEKEKKFVMMQKPFPKKDLTTGEVLREDVEWVITNDDIVKEKFKYSYALNSDPNLTFSSCNAAMVQFTIRNKKQYIEELDEQGEPTGNYYWEQEVPNLQNYEFVEKDPNGNSRKIVGELSGNACIKVYTYINGDSSTLMYLGMFNVDEDKAVDNGYNRQITAYDFMAFFRDCDIFYWYKHLWTGINKLDNDFEDYTNDDEEKEQKKPDDYDNDINWVRKPAKDLYPDRDGRWTIGEALTDLFTNFAAYDMITYDEEEVEVEDPDTHEMKKIKKTVAKLGNTVTNPNSYGRNYEEGNGYTGLGMPVMLDPDLFDNTKEYTIPTETGEDIFECYGYMDALDIEFYQDPNVMKSESLSMGKFLEDIGLLAGRYPYIRNDHLQDDDWFDPANCTGSENRYNNYEKCILTFKPLPTSKDDSKLPTEQMLDNTEISKGFSHESYTVDDIEIVKINFQDKSKIEYSRLTASQRKDKKTGNVQTFTFSDNLFVSYLVEKSDDEEIKKKLENYKALRNKIFGKENKKGNMSSKALFAQGYYNMKYRSYVPYELTTYADPVRDVGDRIKITYTDVITGEHVSFYSYILEREMNGIQKCMDTYRAQGDGLNPIFSNYKTGSKYQSGSSYAASSFGYNAVYSGTGAGGSSGSGALGITPSDLVQYWRNFGIRLLDEPSDCSAKFVKGGEQGDPTAEHYLYNISGGETSSIKDGDTTNPIMYESDTGTKEATVTAGDYVYWITSYEYDDSVVPSFVDHPLYVYTLNGDWKYVGRDNSYGSYGCNVYDTSGMNIVLDEGDGSFYEGSTCNKIIISQYSFEGVLHPYYIEDYDGTGGYKYYGGSPTNWEVPSPTYTEHTETQTITVDYGDFVAYVPSPDYPLGHGNFVYQYPGVWIKDYEYPKLDVPVVIETKKYVSLKWSDPQDITDWKPTPATWEGTVIVRKENSPPLHRWDGEKVVRTTERDKYKTKAYKDEDIKANKVYYYGFFPYYTKISDPDHPIRFYTFTKSIRVETGVIVYAPVIESITVDGNNATITYAIVAPADTIYTSIKLYGRIGEYPQCDDTDDICEDILQSETEYVVGDLDNETYYFVIQCIDINEAEVTSNVEECYISPGEYKQVRYTAIGYDPETGEMDPNVPFLSTYGSEMDGYWGTNIVQELGNGYIKVSGVNYNVKPYDVVNYSRAAIDSDKEILAIYGKDNQWHKYILRDENNRDYHAPDVSNARSGFIWSAYSNIVGEDPPCDDLSSPFGGHVNMMDFLVPINRTMIVNGTPHKVQDGDFWWGDVTTYGSGHSLYELFCYVYPGMVIDEAYSLYQQYEATFTNHFIKNTLNLNNLIKYDLSNYVNYYRDDLNYNELSDIIPIYGGVNANIIQMLNDNPNSIIYLYTHYTADIGSQPDQHITINNDWFTYPDVANNYSSTQYSYNWAFIPIKTISDYAKMTLTLQLTFLSAVEEYSTKMTMEMAPEIIFVNFKDNKLTYSGGMYTGNYEDRLDKNVPMHIGWNCSQVINSNYLIIHLSKHSASFKDVKLFTY